MRVWRARPVTVYSGDIDVVASDDGVNAASSTLGERSDKYAISIAGGDLYIDAGSDGLDSNNDISMTGGKVEVYGADAMMDAAIDYDGTFTLSGGTLFGAGMEPTAARRRISRSVRPRRLAAVWAAVRTDRAAVRA